MARLSFIWGSQKELQEAEQFACYYAGSWGGLSRQRRQYTGSIRDDGMFAGQHAHLLSLEAWEHVS